MVVFLLSPLLTSLRSKLLQSSLLTSLRIEFLWSSLRTSLRSDFLQLSLPTSQWSIYLRLLYKDIPTVIPIPPKPEVLLQSTREITILSNHIKSEASKLWLPLHASLKSCTKLFYKYIGYYVIDWNTDNNTWSIKRQAVGYVMFLKRKQSAKVKAKRCTEGRYHQKFNHKVESSSHIITS